MSGVNDTQELEVCMKRRKGYFPYALTEHKGKIHYLISDGISWGYSSINQFNRIFLFRIRTY